MPENPLAEAHEHIEHLEHQAASRLKIIVTVMILVVTMLATLSGVMAAIWSARHSEAQRDRQEAIAESLRYSLSATQQQAVVDQTVDDVTEAEWRSAFLNTYSSEIGDKSIAAQLTAQAKQADTVAKADQNALPAGSGDAEYAAKLQQPGLIAAQEAKARAEEGVGWLSKNNGALAVVSMLALSLFLLGLTLTIGNRVTQVGFTVLAIAMTLVAAGRLGQIAAEPINTPTASCIDRYGEAVTTSSSGKYDEGAAELKNVTGACSHFQAAWSALGDIYAHEESRDGFEKAQNAYEHALSSADVKSADLYNAAGYAETLNQDYGPAQANLDKASALAPENQIISMSRAELAVARGDTGQANRILDAVLDTMVDRGPYFRNEFFFAAARNDSADFVAAGMNTAATQAFFLKVREAEASLDTIGTTAPKPTSGRITDIVFRKSNSDLGRNADFVTIGFDYTGIKAGDEISLRFYNGGKTFDLTASLNQKVASNSSLVGSGREQPDSDFRLGLSSTGSTTLEVYLNGNWQGSVSLTI